MEDIKLKELVDNLIKDSYESECLEFKLNFHSAEEIGERISALSNGACIQGQQYGYLVFGVEDENHRVVGTSFKAKSHKKGNEELEHWLVKRLNPRIDFAVHEFDYDTARHISMFIIPAAKTQPVEFINQAYIRIGSNTRKINDSPEKQAKIWRKQSVPFEKEITQDNLSAQDVINLLSTETYFDLMKLPYPGTQQGVIDKFLKESLILKSQGYAITKLGALLFAKNLRDFESLERKVPRVIVYKGKNKVETIREQTGAKGYAVGFLGLIDWVNSQLPANEEIGKALRKQTTMYPEMAIREIIANALIHQDLTEKGFPMIEIFTDRIEISNAGVPLVSPDRFLDAYLSRNDKLADIMRRMGFCEEKGSGMDKVFLQNELYQLPPISVIVSENRTRVTMYRYKPLNDLTEKEKVYACYQHACLKYVSNEKMTNQTLRSRFDIEDRNLSIASRIIRDTLKDGLIKDEDPENTSKKYASYVPFWA
jgi:predicted HTH transcriptional regulator